MNWSSTVLVGLVFTFLASIPVECTELTFELEDNARQCFYEDIKKDTKGTLEFQVSVQSRIRELRFLVIIHLFLRSF